MLYLICYELCGMVGTLRPTKPSTTVYYVSIIELLVIVLLWFDNAMLRIACLIFKGMLTGYVNGVLQLLKSELLLDIPSNLISNTQYTVVLLLSIEYMWIPVVMIP